MNNYLDTYFSRINHLGETTAERIRSAGIRSFQKWMAESPHTVRNLSIERGLHFDGLILSDKDKSYQKIMLLNVANDISLLVGDILNWIQDDKSCEKWILIQEEKKVNGTYRTFWIIRCNYLLKWIDADGHLQQSWSYVVSSVDSKIKGNYRTWNSLITPQPNKYAEILMPRYPIDRATNFIIEDESWSVVEYDHTSVPGTIYLSLTENKVNLIYDDLDNDIADTDKLAVYSVAVPAETQVITVGMTLEPQFTLMKDGYPCDEEVEFISQDPTIIDKNLVALKNGETDITVRLKKYPTITSTIHIKVDNETTFTAYIDGVDKIRLDRQATYTLAGSSDIAGEVQFTLNDTTLATIVSSNGAQCVILANKKNLLGDIVLTATYSGETYTKTISIIPLW